MTRFFAGVLLATGMMAADTAKTPDLRDSKAVQAETERIIQTYRSDPKRMNEELEKLNERMAKAAGLSDYLSSLRAREKALLAKYGVPMHALKTGSSGPEQSRTVDLSAWIWAIDRQADKYTVTVHLDRDRYKEVAVSQPRVVLRARGKTVLEEERLQAGEETNGVFLVNIASENLGKSTFRIACQIPDEDVSRYVVQISARLEPDWEVCGVIKLDQK